MVLSEARPLHLPLSSILPPSSSNPGPSHTFPVPNYILGPLPPTSPLHLALHYLDLADDAARENCASSARHGSDGQNMIEDEHDGKGALNTPTRVLLVTGPKSAFQDAIECEDEGWFREHGGRMSVVQKLKRIDMRFCPSVKQLQLLLTLLSKNQSRHANADSHTMDGCPGLVILWNVAELFMMSSTDIELRENKIKEDNNNNSNSSDGNGKQFNASICISDYLNILAAARETANHFSSIDPSGPPTQLVIIEPNLMPHSSLPVLPPITSDESSDILSGQTPREKRILVVDGARYLMGESNVAVIQQQQQQEDDQEILTKYELTVGRAQTAFAMKRQRCKGGDWAVQQDELHGWQWEWQ
ncbi:hypothetical protein C356_00216 [Cryptococcus neoformans c45]|nr:hypothetical protein C356_00216 [Cryptococcus neoformans var. grubii c45]